MPTPAGRRYRRHASDKHTLDDGLTDIADAIKILCHLFASAGPLPLPFGLCGIDPAADGPECISFAPCQGP
ncbi:MAG TPA: hypothetical protein DCM87_06685 [Planctomycetes bacterium]|nr:hypothetical protein [Planctomycetota bacterium]